MKKITILLRSFVTRGSNIKQGSRARRRFCFKKKKKVAGERKGKLQCFVLKHRKGDGSWFSTLRGWLLQSLWISANARRW